MISRDSVVTSFTDHKNGMIYDIKRFCANKCHWTFKWQVMPWKVSVRMGITCQKASGDSFGLYFQTGNLTWRTNRWDCEVARKFTVPLGKHLKVETTETGTCQLLSFVRIQRWNCQSHATSLLNKRLKF
jgi:hypothetical protein